MQSLRFRFKDDNTFEQRRAEALKIRDKYPQRIPVIVEPLRNAIIKNRENFLPRLDKQKFLVPAEISVAQFMWVLRKRISLPPERALFIYINKTIPQNSACMGSVYEELKDSDGFLYVAYSGENTFG